MEILLNNVLPAIIPVFLIMMLGYFIGRKTDYDLKFATDVTMYFTLPALIFSALAHKWDTPFLAREFLITGIGAVFIILGTGVPLDERQAGNDDPLSDRRVHKRRQSRVVSGLLCVWV